MRVLILCTGNSARSQMAEAIMRHVSKGAVEVQSARTRPQPEIHPMARTAVRKLWDLEMTGQQPKSVDRFSGQTFDCLVTVCDNAAETCPILPGHPERVHWNFADPAAVPGTDEQRQQAFDETARELLTRIEQWLLNHPLHRLVR